MGTTIYATFQDSEAAERAAGALLDYGVRPEDVSLVRRRGDEPREELAFDAAAVAGSTGAVGSSGVDSTGHSAALSEGYKPGASKADDQQYDNLGALNREEEDDYDPELAAKSGITPTTAADAGAGAIKGAGVGLGVGAIALLVSIFVPGFGLIAGSGALATALAGAAATTGAGAVAGAVTGYLKDQGMDSHVAEDYGSTLDEGGALISVAVPSGTVDESTVRSILDKYAATHVTKFGGTGSGGYVA
jgi:hypothetical protein